MKRILLLAFCLCLFLLAGCEAVNQTNSFVAFSAPAAANTPEATITPESAATPEITPPPIAPLNVQPTATPAPTTVPAVTDSPAPATETPTAEPGSSPGGFNG